MDLPPIPPLTPRSRTTPGAPTGQSERDASLWSAARSLEATFLSEMLKTAGLGEVSDTFGGGEGEEHFASFLRDEQARAMVAKGGIGLAESLYHSLKDRDHE
ncbi:rod-binding protein [Puniceibacterium sp. IMCC21224]|uniref:rod-binding protein n=1 Tax=Puniceibacterium sp. IMCC21224 TaxID=1618204 RepID=UPI00064DA84B|nr:rod-binding protein [Puniceibacterium sp. IMCC21224]KMK65889.1 Rod binding protein [Puniceibacterium sp. IMCC21224]